MAAHFSYDRLVRLDPAAHVVASYNRALIYMYMGQFDEVFRQLDNAGEPDNPLVRTFKALALYYTGQTEHGGNDAGNRQETSKRLRYQAVLGMLLSARENIRRRWRN